MEENESALLQIDAHLSSNAEKSNAADLLVQIRDFDRVCDNFRYEIDHLDQQFDSINVQLEGLNNKRFKLIKKIADKENAGDDDERILAYAAKTISVMETFILSVGMPEIELAFKGYDPDLMWRLWSYAKLSGIREYVSQE